MVEQASTCCTVETPSRLLLFYPESTPAFLSDMLPRDPIVKPVGNHVTLGRSSQADVRLNEERMSRLYAALWHDGRDLCVFYVSNLSERKQLLVDGVSLRYGQVAEVKDGSVLVLDTLQFQAFICAGDYVATNYVLCFIKNSCINKFPPQDLCGKLVDQRPCSTPEYGGILLSNISSFYSESLRCPGSPPSNVARTSTIRSISSDDVGMEFELPESIIGVNLLPPSLFSEISSGYCTASGQQSVGCSDQQSWVGYPVVSKSTPSLTLDIAPPQLQPPSAPLQQANLTNHLSQQSEVTNIWNCAQNDLNSSNSVSQASTRLGSRDLNPPLGNVPAGMDHQSEVRNPCRSCCSGAKPAGNIRESPSAITVAHLPRINLAQELVNDRHHPYPVENGEWDTDDPNINKFM